MSDGPRIGLALIARDSEQELPTLLESIEGAFDRVVLLDTGSEDDTVALFERWVDDQTGDNALSLGAADSHFDWCDDFGAARRAADELLLEGEGAQLDWTCWADTDDRIDGAANLRRIAAGAPDHVEGFIADYDYARDEHGNCICRLRRERLVRAGAGTWRGRVHEAQVIEGQVAVLPQGMCEWVHCRDFNVQPVNPARNLQILERWNIEEPGQTRVLAYLGYECLSRGLIDEAIRYFEEYLALPDGWPEERAQVHRRYALALRAAGRFDDAVDTALAAIRRTPSWPDSYLTLAEAHYELEQWDLAAEWARETLRRGQPQTLLIISPTDYTVQPRVILAGALAQLGEVEEAIEVAEEALSLCPDHPILAQPYQVWRVALKRRQTARSFIACAEVLCAHDEQLHALQVLEAAPHFVLDDLELIAARSQLRERIAFATDPELYAEHYRTGGSKPEDGVSDPIAVGDQLIRCAFLLQGVQGLAEREKTEVAA